MAEAARQLKKRVLAVDDEQEILDLYTTFLQFRGYEVVTADNAEACIEYLRNDTADILLLDVNMPGIDGLKVLEMIRADVRSQDMRVIMVSARRDEDTVREAVKSGCDGFVVKPFKLKDLAERIATELFTVTEAEIRSILRTPLGVKTTVFREAGATDYNPAHWDPYVVRYKDATLCLLVPRGVRPTQFAKALDEELEKRVVVLFKHPQKWKKVFPRAKRD